MHTLVAVQAEPLHCKIWAGGVQHVHLRPGCRGLGDLAGSEGLGLHGQDHGCQPGHPRSLLQLCTEGRLGPGWRLVGLSHILWSQGCGFSVPHRKSAHQ